MPPQKGTRPKHHPLYKLTPEDQVLLVVLVSLKMWSQAQIARSHGISPSRVNQLVREYEPICPSAVIVKKISMNNAKIMDTLETHTASVSTTQS